MIEQCPKCKGRLVIDLFHLPPGIYGQYWVMECCDCGFSGPVGSTKEEAQTLWSAMKEV